MNEWATDHLPISFVQKILFVHNLYIMVKSGLSLVEGLRILSEQMDNKRLKKILSEIKRQVEKGRQLSEVLSEYQKIFPSIYVSMIAAGETAGKMEAALLQVNNQMKKSHELAARIKGALIYPAVILVAMAGIGIEMVAFVLPKIIVMFNDFHAELPLPTRMLIWTVTTAEHYGLFIAIGLGAFIAFLVWLERKPRIRRTVHAFNLRLPIFGAIIKKINLASFTLTLSSLLQSAIPIVEAVKITASVLGNIKYQEDLLAAAEALKKGEPLSAALNRSPERFPPMAAQMIMVGEQTGELEQMLGELSEYYGDEVDNTMRNFSTIIEPVIILALGAAVAGIAVAVIMPMYSLAQSF